MISISGGLVVTRPAPMRRLGAQVRKQVFAMRSLC